MSGLDWSLSATVNGEWGSDNTAVLKMMELNTLLVELLMEQHW